jgi:hypothetical protein
MKMHPGIPALGGVLMSLLAVSAAAGGEVGTITACYYSAECTYTQSINLTPPVDAPAFRITNTGNVEITDAKFTVLADAKIGLAKDHFFIGTISAGKSVVIVPGFSDDHRKHASGAFFAYTGGPLDTSDAGYDANSVKFLFTGASSAGAVSSGKILTGATAGPSKDGTIKFLNFLGGPKNADGPCDDCFAPKRIATLTGGP